MPSDKESQLMVVAIQLVDSVQDLAKELRLLTEAAQDLYHEIQWAVRNNKFRSEDEWVPTQGPPSPETEATEVPETPASVSDTITNGTSVDDPLWAVHAIADQPQKRRSRRKVTS